MFMTSPHEEDARCPLRRNRARSTRKRLRVLVIMSGTTILGRDLVVESDINQLGALATRGHDVKCILPKKFNSSTRKSPVKSLVLESLTVRRDTPLLSLLVFQLFAFWKVVRSFKRFDAIIFHVYALPIVFPILIIMRKLDPLPALILRVPTNPVDTGWLVRRFMIHGIYKISIMLAARVFDRILFLSPMMSNFYMSQLRIPKEKVGEWPSALDFHLFDPRHVNAAEVNSLRKKFGSTGRLRVLYHGSLTKSRGLVELVDAFIILKKRRGVKATLALLGDGPAKAFLQRYVRTKSLDDSVQFFGPVAYSNVPSYIAASDVGISPLPIHPWWQYQIPTKVLECLAMNRPLIVSDIPAHRYILGRAPVALYLKENTAHGIAEGISEFQANRRRFKPNMGRTIAERFSIEKTATMLELEISSVLTSH